MTLAGGPHRFAVEFRGSCSHLRPSGSHDVRFVLCFDALLSCNQLTDHRAGLIVIQMNEHDSRFRSVKVTRRGRMECVANRRRVS